MSDYTDADVEKAAPLLDICMEPDEYVYQFQERQARAVLDAVAPDIARAAEARGAAPRWPRLWPNT